MKANEAYMGWAELSGSLDNLLEYARSENVPLLLSMLSRLVPEYKPAAASHLADEEALDRAGTNG